MSLELRHLRVVVAIADHGSITQAARALGVAPPSLSAQLRRVERMTGQPLFTRLPRGVRATRAGEIVVQRARSTLADVDALTQGLSQAELGTPSDAALVVGGVNSHWFARFLSAAVGRGGRPVEGRADDSTTILDEWLAAGNVDAVAVAVHGYADLEPPPGCRQVTIVQSQPYLVALGARHPLARKTEVTLADLHDTPWLLPRGYPDGTMPAFLDACRRAGFQPQAPVGPADVTYYSSWLTDEGATCLVSPAYPPAPGVVVVPLRNGVGSEVRLRWNPERISDDDADRLAVAIATAYVDQVREVSAHTDWWRDVPDLRPRLAAALRDRVPALDA
jgi:molybdate transport repressor ModE-like protein